VVERHRSSIPGGEREARPKRRRGLGRAVEGNTDVMKGTCVGCSRRYQRDGAWRALDEPQAEPPGRDAAVTRGAAEPTTMMSASASSASSVRPRATEAAWRERTLTAMPLATSVRAAASSSAGAARG
jgi:hypothetical protein